MVVQEMEKINTALGDLPLLSSFRTGIDDGVLVTTWTGHGKHGILDCFKELQQSRRSSRSGSGGRCKSHFRSCILTARASRTLKKNNRKNTDMI